MDRTEKLSAELQAQGQKITRQRRAILEVLSGNDRPLTADEIFLMVKAGKESTSLATVYRNLKILLAAGLISREGFIDDKAQYSLQEKNHSHNLVCLGCHKIIKIPGCPLENFAASVGEKNGFTVTEHRMELYGYCTECNKYKNHFPPENDHECRHK